MSFSKINTLLKDSPENNPYKRNKHQGSSIIHPERNISKYARMETTQIKLPFTNECAQRFCACRRWRFSPQMMMRRTKL